MKKENLFDIIGDVDEQKVATAGRAMTVKKNTNLIWLKWGAMAACFCLMLTAVFLFNSTVKGPEVVEGPYAIAVAYVGWSDSQTICDGALNKELLKNEPNEHLPIFRMDTLEDLEQFKAQYENVFAMDQGFDNIRSFEAVLKQAQFDREIFYEDNSMLLIYIPANSGSLRFFVDEIITNDNSLCFSVGQKDNQEVVTDDMAGWMLLVKATKEELGKYTSFDAFSSQENSDIQKFCLQNKTMLHRGYTRMTSYWNEFYRDRDHYFINYIGRKVFREYFGYTKSFEK